MRDINKSNLSQLIDSNEFSLISQLVGEELLKLEQRLNNIQVSEHMQTRLMGEINALNRVLRLPEMKLEDMIREEKYKDK